MILVTGIGIGLAIAAPVGPIGLLCIRRTLERGRLAGLATGLGAATADGLYGLAAGLGFAGLVAAWPGVVAALRVAGALALLWLAWGSLRRPPQAGGGETAGAAGSGTLVRAYLGTLLLTLANPATIISFLAIFAGFGVAGDLGAIVLLVAGVFLGSALWWLTLSGIVAVLRHRLPPAALTWIDRVSALALAGFALAAVLPLLK